MWIITIWIYFLEETFDLLRVIFDFYLQLIIDVCDKDTLIAEVILVILLIVVELMKRKWKASTSEEKAKHEKNAKIILKAGILIVAFTALAPVAVSYFQ